MISESILNYEYNNFLNKHGDFIYITTIDSISVHGKVIKILDEGRPRFWRFKDYMEDLNDVFILGETM